MMLQLDKLRDWQRAPAQHLYSLLSAGKNCVDISDCGVGKTYTAMACVAALQLPTLVCAPPISKSQWYAAAHYFGDQISFVGHQMLRTGNSPYGCWQRPLPKDSEAREQLKCLTCQCVVDLASVFPCHCTAAGIHCVEVRRKPHRYGRFTFAPQIKLFVLDEAHAFNALDSLNSDILLAAARQRIPTLCMSATLGNTPANFRALGYLLGLHTLDDDYLGPHKKPRWSTWAAQHKLRRDTATPGQPMRWFAGESEQQQIMRNIRAEIIPARGVRIAKSDIPNFPDVDISAELFDLEAAGRINEIYQQMWDELTALEERRALDKSPDAAITIQLRANQAVELLKVPIAAQLAESYIEQGLSVGIFVNFSQTISSLAMRLKTNCIVDGFVGHKYRQACIDLFQSNKSKIILINAAAGGLALNLQDTTGEHPRSGLVFPGFSSTVFKQLIGRFPRDGSKSKSFYKVILAAGTADEKIHRSLRLKLNNLDSLLDADLQPDNLRLTTAAA